MLTTPDRVRILYTIVIPDKLQQMRGLDYYTITQQLKDFKVKYTMRAKEFTINIPINIKINDDGDPVIDVQRDSEESEFNQNPVMVPPLQQELELAKAQLGKESPVIDKLTADDTIGAEPSEDQILALVKRLLTK